MVARGQSLRVRKRSDLFKLSQQYPGALGALFLMQVKTKMLGGSPDKVGDLYRIDPSRWATSLTGLTEIRDLREVQLLSKVVGKLNSGQVVDAVDLAAMRIKELLHAKVRSGGTWDTAALVSLMPADGASVSAAMPDSALEL